MTALLSLQDIHSGYGESCVLEGVSAEVQAGEVVCLLGANGAGKTTLMRTITGLLAERSGRMIFDGADLARLASHDRVDAGIALSPEGRQVFPNLSVQENLYLGSFSRRARSDRQRKIEEVYHLFPRLAERKTQAAGLMSGGEQQMLAIGRALMACPRLLLLDEPSLGLAPKLIGIVFEAIERIARTGVSILLVEQNAHAALSVARRGYVLAEGRITMEGTSDTLKNSEVLQTAFLHRRSIRHATAQSSGGQHA
jgi:branched-chain amino acid transport system ATP-binding protein